MEAGSPMMTAAEAVRFIADHGIVLESAKGSVPSLLEAALGRRPRGGWWADPKSHEFFALTRRVRRSPDLLVCRLVGGKVTFVHRRLWPALARMQHRVGARAIEAIEEVHTPSGAHRLRVTPFRRWVSADVLAVAGKLSMNDAVAALGASRVVVSERPARRG